MQKMQRAKIELLIAKLDAGKKVSKRDIANVLGAVWLERYELEWATEKATRTTGTNEFKDKEAIKRALLASALNVINDAENTPEAIAQREILKMKLTKLMTGFRDC